MTAKLISLRSTADVPPEEPYVEMKSPTSSTSGKFTFQEPKTSRHKYEWILPFALEHSVSLTEPQMVSIVKIIPSDNGNTLEVDEEALTTIFSNPEISDLPVVLLSVSGAFRKGKSFLLNFFLRYMRNKGYDNPDWLGEDNIDDGFEWRGGKSPMTQGIIILNEPFIVNVGKKPVAVLLMDTQGLFDNYSDKKLCTQIFALSTLLSSIQVFNLSQQIQENDLEYLQCFTEYAKVAQAADVSQGPSFQNLMFVIRDWQELEDHEYGLDEKIDQSGRTGYLSDVLSCSSKNSELAFVRKHLHSSFEDIQCFLLPHPGLNVAVTKKEKPFKGEIKDIAPEFLEHVQVLSDILLNPKHLVPKTIYGDVITGNSLINYAISCSKSFASGNLPEPQLMIENAAEVMNLQALNTSLDMYAYEMDKILTKEKYLEEEKLRGLNKVLVKKAMELYDKNCSLSTKEATENVRRNLVDTLMEQFELYRRRNYTQGKEITQQVHGGAIKLANEYTASMLKLAERAPMEDSELSVLHRQNLKLMTAKFQSKYDGQPGYYEALETLRNDITFTYSVLERVNSDKLKTETLKKKENEAKMIKLVEEYLEYYNGKMYEFTKSFVDPSYFVDQENKIREEVLKKFEVEAKKSSGKGVEKYKDILRERMKEEFDDLVTKNEENKKILLRAVQQKKRKLVVEYRFLMQLGMRDSYVEPKVLNLIHKKFESILADRMIRDDDMFEVCYLPLEDPILRQAAKELKEDLKTWHKKILAKNEKNREVFLKTTSGSKTFFSSIVRRKSPSESKVTGL